MNDVIAAALELQIVCQKHGWRFCFIGGIAVQRWSEPRLTVDVDGILARQWEKLDFKLVRKELKPLAELKAEPAILARLEQKITRYNQPFTRIKRSKRRQ